MKTTTIKNIQSGNTALGLEFGSTRIKAVLLDPDNHIIATGSHQWENQFHEGVWTYSEAAIWQGLQSCYSNLVDDVSRQYNVVLQTVGAIGISGMMHGYIALDASDNLVVPFRTWRNTMTKEASEKLSKKFIFHVPQRWTIAHLYQALLNKEEHLNDITHVTTLAGYVHYKLTGQKVVGIGEASGIFPIDSTTKDYDQNMVDAFESIIQEQLPYTVKELLPHVLVAGEEAGQLTKQGALLLDPSGQLSTGIPFAPPEGDAQTGMIATNAIKVRTGNVSAGTSIFAMVVLDKPLSKPYEMIDIVTTPVGDSVAMVHVNNCTSDINAWVEFVRNILQSFGQKVSDDELFQTIFQSALQPDVSTGKMLAYNYFSGEHITGVSAGRPLLVRTSDSEFTLGNVMKVHLFSALATLRIGMDTLMDTEQTTIDSLTGHGGLFKTPIVGATFLASALNTPITTLTTAGEGGPYGMALLANYMVQKEDYDNLENYLNIKVFSENDKEVIQPVQTLHQEFNEYLASYKKGLDIERIAIKQFE
ncbi:xylulokinase [Candidatus Xianfuyuplasma coldseepsis]|uniref:ATPase n=1 Tax=Candidatus Xianfuyuplasma coldseepsis TaxID=2782163 RepID=A0A7L7KU01_9MOLU|nr:FGGY-family carbohydrate kinase [Xianfuyuplasma coldseepsis]QMS85782.1 ATPase [Xianfuyuplasma coldseepsis]